MCYISDHIIPGKVGQTFCIGINNPQEYERVFKRLKEISGIEAILLNDTAYPFEVTIQTNKPVAVKEVQDAVRKIGFHAVKKTFF